MCLRWQRFITRLDRVAGTLDHANSLSMYLCLTVPLLLGALHLLKTDRARIALLTVLWASALVVRLVIYLRGAPWTDLGLYGALYFRSYTRFDTLVAGILLAFVHRRYQGPVGRWLACTNPTCSPTPSPANSSAPRSR